MKTRLLFGVALLALVGALAPPASASTRGSLNASQIIASGKAALPPVTFQLNVDSGSGSDGEIMVVFDVPDFKPRISVVVIPIESAAATAGTSSLPLLPNGLSVSVLRDHSSMTIGGVLRVPGTWRLTIAAVRTHATYDIAVPAHSRIETNNHVPEATPTLGLDSPYAGLGIAEQPRRQIAGRYLYASLPCIGTKLLSASAIISRQGVPPVTLTCPDHRRVLLIASRPQTWQVNLNGVGGSNQPWALGLG